MLQLDARRGGFFGNMQVARLGEPAGAVTIPHNWASQIGVFVALHLSKVVKSIPMVEDDRSKLDAIVATGYEFADGSYKVSNEPGLGIRVNSKVYAAQSESKEKVV